MLTFKSPEDLSKLPENHPAFPVVKEIISPYITDTSYRPQDDGYVALLERQDLNRVLSDLDMPWRLSEVPFESSTMIDGYFHAVYLPNNQFALSILVPDAEWLPCDVRRHLEAYI